MLPSYLRHSAGAAWDTVPIWEQKSPATESLSVFTAGMPAKLTRVQLRRHAGGKDCDVSCCRRHYVLICWRSIARQYRRLCRRYFGGKWEPGFTLIFVPGGICLSLFIFLGFTNTIFKQGVYHTEREVQITNPVEHNSLVIFQDSVDPVKFAWPG